MPRVIDAPAGTIVLMDSRLLHHGGAHTVWSGPPTSDSSGGGGGGGGGGDGGGSTGDGATDDARGTERVVFYFSWATSRTVGAHADPPSPVVWR